MRRFLHWLRIILESDRNMGHIKFTYSFEEVFVLWTVQNPLFSNGTWYSILL